MWSSSRSMVWVAGVGAMLLVIPALAQSQGDPDTASYTSFDSAATGAMFRWYVTATTTTDVTIAQHGTVTFTNPSSTSRAHNVAFVSDQKPQCKLSTDNAASTAPMPPTATAGQWSGTCVFDQPGTYRFVCDNAFHPNMVGAITVAAPPAGTVGGTVPPTLSLSLGAPASFGPFTPGASRSYDATMTANVISSAGDATLSVTDPSSTATGRLVNGQFALDEPLQARASSAGGTGSSVFAPLSTTAGNPLTLLTYAGPTANDTVTIGFRQHVAANQELRTGNYAKTLTFTVSTTTP